MQSLPTVKVDKKTKAQRRDKDDLKKRFFAPPKVNRSVNALNDKYHPDLILNWFEQTFHKRIKGLIIYRGDGKMEFSDNDIFKTIVNQAIEGILLEGRILGKVDQAAFLAEELKPIFKNDPQHLMKHCVYLYTSNTFLYSAINQALRDDKLEKASLLCPFSFLLNEFILQVPRKPLVPTELCRFTGIVWRSAKLDEGMIQEYRNLKMQKGGKNIFQWNGFTSTSKSRRLANSFEGNVLFKIKIIDEYCVDISKISFYPKEQEVLLRAGSVFTVKKIFTRNNKHFIYLTCFYPHTNDPYPDTEAGDSDKEDIEATEFLDRDDRSEDDFDF